MNIGNQIRALRMRRGVRQDDLAEYLGVSAQAVSKWETEASLPDIALLPRIAVYFGVTIDDLFRLPDQDHMARIRNAIMCENPIDDQSFHHDCALLRRCIDENRNVFEAKSLLADLYLHRARQDRRMADKLAREALQLEPDSHDAWSALIEANGGACGDEWYDNSAELIVFCQDFLQKRPDTYRALYAIVENMLRDDRFQEAVPYIEQLGKLGNPGQYEFYTGDVCFVQGQIEAALSHWNKAVQDNPDTWQVWCSHGDRMKKLRRYDEALNDYAHSVEIQSAPKIIDGLYARAQLFEQLGQYENAILARQAILQTLKTDYNTHEGGSIDEQTAEIQRLKRKISSQS